MGEIAVVKERVVRTIEKNGVQALIKPLVKEIFLDNVYVRGVLLCGEKLAGLKEDDVLQLKRENEPYDQLIVAVFNNAVRIGELSEWDESIFARLLDAGKKLVAKVKKIVMTPEYNSLEISITMVDY